MKNVKTVDGFDVIVGSQYYLQNGEEVTVEDIYTNSEGKVTFALKAYYEGDTMTVNCYGGEIRELSGSWECESELFYEQKIYNKPPVGRLEEKYNNLINKIESLSNTNNLIELDIKNKKDVLNNLNRTIKQTIESNKKIFIENEKLIKENENLSEEIINKTQILSELEDSIESIRENDVSDLISKDELIRLRKIEFKMQCLESGGVDNWSFYDESLEDYRQRYPKD